MGCGASTEIDYGAVAYALEAQEAKDRQQLQRQYSNHYSEPTGGFNKANKTENYTYDKPSEAPMVAERAVSEGEPMSVKVKKGAHHLKNVFAAPLENLHEFQAPNFPKSNEEMAFILKSLKQNFVFSALTDKEMKTLLDAFERIEVADGDGVIMQGDVGDYFYVIREGAVHFEVDRKKVGEAKKGKSFGELALLYTSPRAASAIADCKSVMYRVDQKTFRYILQSQTLQTENDKKELLQGVTFLNDLDQMDIDKLISTMCPRKFQVGEYIVRKGDEGDTFFVIQEGKVWVKDISIGMTDYEDQVLGQGEYFGERALIKKEPRSANVVGKTAGTVLVVDKGTFETVVGNLSQLILKSQDKRKLVSSGNWRWHCCWR
jgi:cAMP-dependent protein kinase regulator